MLKISKIQSSTASSHYYEKDDYYAKDDPEHQKCSQWHGQLTENINLKGQVDKKDFLNILEGKLSNGQTLGNKIINKETGEEEIIHDKGRDFIFSAPKSVSIASLVYNQGTKAENNNSNSNNNLITAHEDAVKSTINYIEKNYLTFRTKDTATKEIIHHQSQKLISALFRHHSNREQDPQLHTHAIIANIAYDKNNLNEYRCANFDKAYEDSKFLGAVYRSYLAKNITDLGYKIEGGNNIQSENINNNQNKLCFFELKEIPNQLNNLFSKRSQQIKEVAGDNKNSKFLDRVALFTRKDKQNKNIQSLKQLWQAEARKELNIKDNQNHQFNISANKNNQNQIISNNNASNNKSITIKQSLSYAISHLSEGSVVFEKKDLIAHTLDHNFGDR